MLGVWFQLAFSTVLDKVLDDPRLSGAIVSATVTDTKGNILYGHHSALHMTPASNQKLLSNAFALYELGPEFRPKTRFWFTARGTVIESEGDPMMSFADLQGVIDRFRPDVRRPVQLRQAYAPVIPDSWEIDDLPFRYAAPVTALTFDRATFELRAKNGRPSLFPRDFGVRVEQAPAAARSVTYDPFKKLVTVRGPIPVQGVLDTLTLPRADLAAASLFGTSVTLTTKVPASAPDFELTGAPIGKVVEACLPPSDNNLAEHLFLLGAGKQGPVGENPYGLARERATKFFTRVVGVEPGDFHIYDGSGMSRHNYVTTRGLCRLLAWTAEQPYAALWRGAMARPGKGTLAKRLEGIEFEGKTGSLDMVASLSGYLKTKSGRECIVSMIVNNYDGPAANARAVIDAFFRAVSDTGN